MLLTVRWCDLNSVDPQAQPEAVPVKYGGEQLVVVGGDGTPGVAEFAFAEYAIARSAHVNAIRSEAADALDLRHRLPNLYAALLGLDVEVWVARKIASMSRRLSREQVGLVDVAVTEAVHESPGRLLAIAEAKVIEADVEGYREKVRKDAARTGVWLQRKKPGGLVDEVMGEADVQGVTVRIPTASAVQLDATVEDLADALAANAEVDPATGAGVKTRDEWRAEAMALLADPHAAAAFLDSLDATHQATDDAEPAGPLVPLPTRTKRHQAVLHVFCHLDVLTGQVPGVARAGDLGPLLMEQVAELLKHREITLVPVIDLNTTHSVNSYEHPTKVKQRTLLRTVYEVFPHSGSRATRRLDHDHPSPYDKTGPPGQTGDHNDAPLTRYTHRAKTHASYQVRQLALGVYRWVTPHGLGRLVTPRGPRTIEIIHGDRGVVGEIYPHQLQVHIDYDAA